MVSREEVMNIMYVEAMLLYDTKNPRPGHIAVALFMNSLESGVKGYIYSFGTPDGFSSCAALKQRTNPYSGVIDKIEIFSGTHAFYKLLAENGYNHKMEESYKVSMEKCFKDIAREQIKEYHAAYNSGEKKSNSFKQDLLTLMKDKDRDKDHIYSVLRYNKALSFKSQYHTAIDVDKMHTVAEELFELSKLGRLKYSLFNGNCAHFARYVLQSGGVICPQFDYSIADFFEGFQLFEKDKKELRIRKAYGSIPDELKQESPEYFRDKYISIGRVIWEGVKIACLLQ